jgi:hypothetical protein
MFLALGGAAAACTSASTELINEGPGQPSDRASGVVPDGSVGACRVRQSKRPPLVSETLWEHLRYCSEKTPRRFLRLGYGTLGEPIDAPAERRMQAVMEALQKSPDEQDGNLRMLSLLRTARAEAREVGELATRVERASSRTFACDYKALFNTMEQQYAELEGQTRPCPTQVYDPIVRSDVCLFDQSLAETAWLTSSWDCFARTGTPGEGASCYRLCAYDDHCAAQVSCASADYDLILCSLGVCMPDKYEGFY